MYIIDQKPFNSPAFCKEVTENIKKYAEQNNFKYTDLHWLSAITRSIKEPIWLWFAQSRTQTTDFRCMCLWMTGLLLQE